MLRSLRAIGVLAGASLLILGVSTAVRAADYPERLITFVVPMQVGGGGDATSRLLVPFLERHLGDANIVVINKPGGNGLVAYNDLAHVEPDGYTIGLAILPALVTGPIERNTRYTLDSFSLLGSVSTDPTSISVLESSRYRTLQDLIEMARQRPGEVTLAVPGLASPHGIAARLFVRKVQVNLNLVPLGDGGPTRTALLGGHVPAAAISLGAVARHRDRLRILGQMADVRSPHGSWVPTFKEQGIDLTYGVHRAIIAPAGLPVAVATVLREAVRRAATDPAFLEAARAQRLPIQYVSGPDLERLVVEQDRTFRALWQSDPWTR